METDTLARNRKKSQKKAMVKNAIVTPPSQKYTHTAQNGNR